MSENKPASNALPLDLAWREIEEKLKTHQNLVLVAEPGAGKTTRFPPLFLNSGLVPRNQKILMLEPRRLAARASAGRIAEEQGWTLGNEVGYQVRFDNRTSRTTRLEVLTEGLLSRRLQSDPELKDVGAVILDEFHERSQHTDLALGLLFELQQLARTDLRLIVMSATLDAERVSSFLNDAPVVKVPGRIYPVEIFHSKKPLSLDTGPSFLDSVAAQVMDVVSGAAKREGDVLVFLPGTREIRGVRERIQSPAERAGFQVFELHGSLPLEDQDRAIRRARDGKSKIVLATNIAETSLTIDGVGTVVDSGLARVVRLDSAGFERLGLSRISLASATQRAGRAGRQSAGHCYRLWSKLDEASFPPFEQPELFRTDLSDALITLLSQGVTDAEKFSWFEKPSSEAIQFATNSLTDLGIRDENSGALTNEGREALKLPLTARLARLVLEAHKVGATNLGAILAALLSERDIATRAADLKRQARIESDVLLRLHLLENDSQSADRISARNVRRVADAISQAASRIDLKRLKPAHPSLKNLDGDDLALRLLLMAYPDRVCRRRRAKEPQARMVGGRGVTLAPFSAVETADLFIAIDSTEPPPFLKASARIDAQVSFASRIERSWLEEFFPGSIQRFSQLAFDSATMSVQKQTALSFHDLPLEEAHVSRPPTDEAFATLVKAARELWDTKFAQEESLARLISRIDFAKTSAPDDALNFDSESARTSFLEEACFGETKISDVLAKPLGEIYLRHLPKELLKFLDEVPDAITVPSGSRIRVHYPENRAPYLEVRIQEVFGLKSSPRIGRSRVAIVMHLLGPNYRPVQVTSDLESFWKTGYSEVRKELRSRYPKHSWPEDPTTATPEAKGRRRT